MTETTEQRRFEFRAPGWCPLCEQTTEFVAVRDEPLPEAWFPNWFRGDLKCERCQSLPRERALFTVLQMLYPNWRNLDIHESSPSPRGASQRIKAECQFYVESQYDPAVGLGNTHSGRGYRSEDLEAQTFPSESFDVVLTQDVFEHLFHPDRAIREIARTLRRGGAHIMTVPIVRGNQPSVRRARIANGAVQFLMEAQYHGNPMAESGSLVTIDWGYDIIDYLAGHSGLAVSLYYFDDLRRGMRASCLDVLVCRKLASAVEL
jgi:SAM-dependent methyltransferase